MAKNVIVTGGLGFIGSNIARHLSEDFNITIIDTPSMANIKNLWGVPYVLIRPEDKSRVTSLAELSAVIHMGAISSTTETDTQQILSSNIDDSIWWKNFCLKRDIPLIYASSASVYGDGASGFEDDSNLEYMLKLKPLNLYSWSKHYIDCDFIRAGYFTSRAPIYGLRFFNVYGESEDSKGNTASVLSQRRFDILKNNTIQLFRSEKVPPHEASRDFVSVKLILQVISKILNNEVSPDIYNIGTGVALTFTELFEHAIQFASSRSILQYIPIPDLLLPQYQFFTQASVAKLTCAMPGLEPSNYKMYLQEYVTSWKS